MADVELLFWFILINQSAFPGSSDLQPAAENSTIDPSLCFDLNVKFIRMPSLPHGVSRKDAGLPIQLLSHFFLVFDTLFSLVIVMICDRMSSIDALRTSTQAGQRCDVCNWHRHGDSGQHLQVIRAFALPCVVVSACV
jgi:hypothetical protein